MNIIVSSADVTASEYQEESIQAAREIYNIAHWSEGFFDIDDSGNIVAYPNTSRDYPGIVLQDLVRDIQMQGLCLPVLVRFTDIIHQRIKQLRQSFSKAIAEYRYQGEYTCVYPIKVNQRRHVVEKILEYGNPHMGLEAGSKPELMAVLALSKPNSLIVCNGYKDQEYIRLALIAQKLGHRVAIILEKMSELGVILKEAQALNIEPQLGVRIRLATTSAGKWQKSGGQESKFGLSPAQLLEVIKRLQTENCLHLLQIIHFHLGSQVANIIDIQRGLKECARYYAELRAQGVNIHTVDVGGGLSVDYEGSHTRSFCSMNYTIQEYANNVVYSLFEICDEHDLPHPCIITESGRALTAHHALLITNIIDVEQTAQYEEPVTVNPDDPQVLQNLWDGLNSINPRSALEAYHDACYWMNEAHIMYTHGILDLVECSRAEQLYFETCKKVRRYLKPSVRSHRQILDELNEKLADKYFVNFSLFQSLPDAWAIDQVFPVLPLTGLSSPLVRRGILQDITCDSDGRIDFYVDNQGLESSLPLIQYREDKPYLLGIFLLGAYQEILGDMHNLFGDTHSVHVELKENGQYELVEPIFGDCASDVLRYVQYEPQALLCSYEQQLDTTDLSEEEKRKFREELQEGLTGYTYHEGQ